MTAATPDSDDAAWLAALAGRSIAHVDDDRAAIEGTMLRRALQQWAPTADEVAHDPERLARLIARAKAEGLFDEREPAASATRDTGFMAALVRRWRGEGAKWSRHPAWAMAAAIIVVVGVVSVSQQHGERIEPVERATGGVILLDASDPEALQRRLIDELAAQGVKATPYTRFGRRGLDADLPQPLPPALRELLDSHRIAVPGDGVLRVEIEAAHR
jgi:hypothetical protein